MRQFWPLKHIWTLGVTFLGVYCEGMRADSLHAAPAFYTVNFGEGKTKKYEVIPTKRGTPQIVYINFQEDQEALTYTLDALSKKISPQETDIVIVIGNKATLLGAFLARHHSLPWIVLSAKKPFKHIHETAAYSSITSGVKTLYLTSRQADQIKGKRVIIVDDVLSTGATMKAAIHLVRNAGAMIGKIAVGFTEGLSQEALSYDGQTYKIVKAGHLPIFTH